MTARPRFWLSSRPSRNSSQACIHVQHCDAPLLSGALKRICNGILAKEQLIMTTAETRQEEHKSG